MACSVRGASHEQNGQPNQDACLLDVGKGVFSTATDKKWYCNNIDAESLPVSLLLADGHGSKRHFRSERGSRFAVEMGREAFHKIYSKLSDNDAWRNNGLAQDRVSEMLDNLINSWGTKIAEDVDHDPFSSEQIDLVANRPEVAYGSTLLGVLVTQHWTLYIQLGDGDILVLDKDGKVSQPIAKSAELIANETTSLCQENAAKKVKYALKMNSDNSPWMLMLSTDGYLNSFREESSLLQAGHDFQTLLYTKGPEYIDQELEIWLTEMTKEGSGDDITLGLLYRNLKASVGCTESETLQDHNVEVASSGTEEPVDKENHCRPSELSPENGTAQSSDLGGVPDIPTTHSELTQNVMITQSDSEEDPVHA